MSITGGGLDPIVAELKSLRAEFAKHPRAVWATVTQRSPLRIQIDGDSLPMASTPAQTSAPPAVGSRVLCLMQNGRATVIGNAPDPEMPVVPDADLSFAPTSVGAPMRSGLLALLHAALRGEAARCVVVVTGSSTFRGGSARIGATERLAYLAGSPDFPLLEDQTSRPSSGMRWLQGAVGGTTASNYLNEARLTKIDLVDPNYVIHGVGSNDYGSQVAINTYKANLRSKLTRIESDVPGVVNILVHQQARSDSTTRSITWDQYGTAMREVAEENPDSRLFIDLDAVMAPYRLDDPSNPWGMQIADKIHLNDKGYKALATALGYLLGIPSAPPLPEEIHAPSVADSATYPSGSTTTLASLDLVPARYPRTITLTFNGYAHTSTDGPFFRIDASGLPRSFTYRIPATGENTGISVTHDFYLPPNTSTTAAVILTANSAPVYVSGAAGYAYFTVTERAY